MDTTVGGFRGWGGSVNGASPILTALTCMCIILSQSERSWPENPACGTLPNANDKNWQNLVRAGLSEPREPHYPFITFTLLCRYTIAITSQFRLGYVTKHESKTQNGHECLGTSDCRQIRSPTAFRDLI